MSIKARQNTIKIVYLTETTDGLSVCGSRNFELSPDSDEVYYVSSLRVLAQDADIQSEEYGGIGTALTTGIVLSLVSGDDESAVTTLTAEAIKSNAMWAEIATDVQNHEMSGGDDAMIYDFDFKKDYGQYLKLIGAHSDKLRIRLCDDFSDLSRHTFLVHYIIEGDDR